MKTYSQRKDIEQYHSKCVCQTCTCHSHRCPPSDIHFPVTEISSYQNDYHEHPINVWQKPPPERPQSYRPYGNISSSYQSFHPGKKPQMREKLVPRVKNEDRYIPFDGASEYKNQFPTKRTTLQKQKIKDRWFAPCKQPFQSSTSYAEGFPKRKPNPHQKREELQCQFPDGYGFYGKTTYGNSFEEKPLKKSKSYKPEEKLAPNTSMDLNSIYRDSFKQKSIPEPCPILKMPERAKRLRHPHQHLVYNKHSQFWEQK